MLTSKDVVGSNKLLQKQNEVRNELKIFIKKLKSEGISDSLSEQILSEIFYKSYILLGEYRSEIPLLEQIHEGDVLFRSFIRINKSTSLGKGFSFANINLSVKDGNLCLVSEDDKNKFLTISNSGRPSILVDELVLYSTKTQLDSNVYNSPFPKLERVYLKPINKKMFEDGFKSYIQKRIISELSFKLKWYTISEFIKLDHAEKTLSFLKELNKD